MSFVNFNIVTVPGNIDELRCFIHDNPIDILTLNETRLDSKIPNDEINIDGYNVIRKDRNRQGGGVAMYVNQNAGFSYKLRDDLMSPDLEMISIEVTRQKTKPFVVITWYRPPSSKIELFDYIQAILGKVECENKEVFLMGDVNCDLFANVFTCYTNKMNEISDSFHLKQVITEATRVTEKGESLIDHIYTTCPDKICKSGVIHTGMSDHCFVYVIIGKEKNIFKQNYYKYSINRNYKKLDENSFISDMRKVNWSEITCHDNIDDAVNDFENKFLKVANIHAPMRRKRVRKQISPWLTDEIVKAMRERDKLKKEASKSNSPQSWMEYRKHKNKVNGMIKTSKKSFINNEINTKDSKKIWKGLRYIVPGKAKSSKISSIMTETGEKTDPKEIANCLNDYFATIGPNLAKDIPDVNTTCSSQFDQNHHQGGDKFNFSLITEEYVFDQLCSLSNNKATGTDDISSKLLKLSAKEIVAPLTYLINLSLSSGTFPKSWKNARICPIYKGGKNSEPCNYRPISILPILSKIVERAVFDQMYPHLNSNNMLHENQSGFRPCFSTSSALLNVTEDWLNAIDKGCYVGIVMLDLKKAFDTVNHNILINKLHAYGMASNVIKWFSNYLNDRRHMTYVNGVKSNEQNATCGIPQGSILGPLLFIMYVNDLPNCVSNSQVSMYADDTGLYYISRNIKDIVSKINEDLENVSNWLTRNKLSLNVKKTEFMIIGTSQRLAKIVDSDINIKIKNERIKRVKSCKHLGVIIDETLSWGKHVDHVTKKVAPGLYYLRKSSSILPQKMQVLLYNAIIIPHLSYCNIIWGRCNKTLQNKCQVLQNRAAKIITSVNMYSSSSQALQDLNWDNLNVKLTHNEAITMYKIVNNLAPQYLCNKFKRKEENYNMRVSNTLCIDKPNTEYKRRSFTYRGAKLWNSLEENIKNAVNVTTFKQQLRNVITIL